MELTRLVFSQQAGSGFTKLEYRILIALDVARKVRLLTCIPNENTTDNLLSASS
jgi:hypothetical protein